MPVLVDYIRVELFKGVAHTNLSAFTTKKCLPLIFSSFAIKCILLETVTKRNGDANICSNKNHTEILNLLIRSASMGIRVLWQIIAM